MASKTASLPTWSSEIVQVHELSDQFHILEVIINDKIDQSNRRKFWYLIDWSGSMYNPLKNKINYSKIVERSLSKLLSLASDGGNLTRFSTVVNNYGDFTPDIMGERTLNGLRNDDMECTNLPLALDQVTTLIAEFAKVNPDVLNILIFVSDGKYTLGKDVPVGDPTEIIPSIIEKMTTIAPDYKLSVVCLAIDDADIKFFAACKSIETVEIYGILPIFYAKTSDEITTVCEQLKCALTSTQVYQKVNAPSYCIIDNICSPLKQNMTICGNIGDHIFLLCNSTILPFKPTSHSFDATIPALSRLLEQLLISKVAIASTDKKNHLQLVEACARFETILASFEKNLINDIGKQIDLSGKHGVERLMILRKHMDNSSITVLDDMYKQLKELKLFTTASDTHSSDQVEFLTGANKKFAKKALSRSKPIDWRTDCELIARSIEDLGSICPIPIWSVNKSYGSLQSPLEMAIEYSLLLKTLPYDLSEIEALCTFTLPAIAIYIESSPIAQCDPWLGIHVSTCLTGMFDTSTMWTCHQLKIKDGFKPPEGGRSVTQVFVPGDPQNPVISKLFIESKLNELNNAALICGDFRINPPGMYAALNANIICSTVRDDNKSRNSKLADVEAEIRRAVGERAFQCTNCGYGPILHGHCYNLASHHGEQVGNTVIKNDCPICHWFDADISNWHPWDGTIPVSMKPVPKPPKPIQENYAELICKLWWGGRVSGLKRAEYVLKITHGGLFTSDKNIHPLEVAYSYFLICGKISDTDRTTLRAEMVARAVSAHIRMVEPGSKDDSIFNQCAEKCAIELLGIRQTAQKPLPFGIPEPTNIMCTGEPIYGDCSIFNKFDVADATYDLDNMIELADRLHSLAICPEELRLHLENGNYKPIMDILLSKSFFTEMDSQDIRMSMLTQALCHPTAATRRIVQYGGKLTVPLADVRDPSYISSEVRRLQLSLYHQLLVPKQKYIEDRSNEELRILALTANIGRFRNRLNACKYQRCSKLEYHHLRRMAFGNADMLELFEEWMPRFCMFDITHDIDLKAPNISATIKEFYKRKADAKKASANKKAEEN